VSTDQLNTELFVGVICSVMMDDHFFYSAVGTVFRTGGMLGHFLVKSRDVPDIRFRLAGYPAIF